MRVIFGRYWQAAPADDRPEEWGARVSVWMPCLLRRPLGDTGVEVRLGHELVDDYLRFVASRCRPNTVLAAGFDLKVFFDFVGKDPVEVSTADVLAFITEQRVPRHGANVVVSTTVNRACPRAPSAVGCRRCPACSVTCSPGVWWQRRRCRPGLPPAVQDVQEDGRVLVG